MVLNYNEYGSGSETLLILHGFLGASGNWHTLSRNVFGQQRRVFALDLRNHGESPHSDEFGYDAMKDDVVQFIEEHDLGKVDIAGHSMGGKVAMQLALRRSDLVRKLVVVDMAPGLGMGGHEHILSALQSVNLDGPTSRQDVDDALAKTIKDKPVRQFLLKNLRSVGDGMYEWKNNLPVLAASYDHLNDPVSKGVFEGPVLFVKGQRSNYIRDSDWPEIVERFPAAKLVEIARAGHWVHAENPEDFAAAIVGFLES